jgi:hypothetical protein
MSGSDEFPRWMKLSFAASALLITSAWVTFLVYELTYLF